MTQVLELELRIEAVYASWFRNAIILITLAAALKNIDIKISNVVLTLSLCVILYIYKNLIKLKDNIHEKKLYKFNILLSLLLLTALLVLYYINI
jgi:hypothetical protein